LRVLALGAHCDDVEIGAGATILRLLAERPGAALCIVIAASDDVRAAEARASASALVALAGAAPVELHVGALTENVLPAHTGAVRDLVLEHGRPFAPDIVFAPHLQDRHQDHRVVAEVAHQLFRDHPIFEYEIAKYDGDLHTPNVYAPVEPDTAAAKVDLLHQHFPSQHGRRWFDREAFLSLLRLRGIECNARYAEGFHVRKLAI
jgi:LmbE family N-acetylglucosaminyl deacetylase